SSDAAAQLNGEFITLSSILLCVWESASEHSDRGGQPAPEGAWPWQVSIHRGGGHICGGSLINNLWVLSAAHCFQRDNTVYIGRQSQENANANEVRRTIVEVINHESFNNSTLDNDIALLKMAFTVTFTNYIRPVCLAASGSTVHAGTDSWTTGWGNIGSGSKRTNLMEVEVPVVGNRKCKCNYAEIILITDNMICAGLEAGGKGRLWGPMVSKQNSRWIQSGVVSFALRCALPNKPTVYARVSRYQSWINSKITENQPGFITFTSSGTDSDLSASCSLVPPLTTAKRKDTQNTVNNQLKGTGHCFCILRYVLT
uniref:Peptidase S1 domain-containing protein n=1 Tax=Neogobius melanostomus TaxID=47308 RepID=A0A8C6TH08_9GOBI